ncbi:MAG: hypothetical protein IK094_05110 [Treponema sp.]|nr:hypothetical protein [Treponema sp.]
MNNSIRTFIYKIGDNQADTKIQSILGEGWKISAVTPNGSVRITTFSKSVDAGTMAKPMAAFSMR